METLETLEESHEDGRVVYVQCQESGHILKTEWAGFAVGSICGVEGREAWRITTRT